MTHAETKDLDRRQLARRAAARAAVARVEAGMVVGLGTGDTAAHAVRALAERGLKALRCVATSQRTSDLARSLGLPLVDLDDLDDLAAGQPVDLTIDGADEIDPLLQLIKGGGGALLREKLVAQSSRQLLVVADGKKRVQRLGETFPLPLEIVPFGATHTLRRVAQAAGHAPTLRRDGEVPRRSDEGNLIADLPTQALLTADPAALHAALKGLCGVIETGLFLTEATRAFIGHEDGSVLELARG